MKNNTKKIVVLVALVLVVTVLSVSFYSYLNGKDGISIVGIERNQFAMYKQDENGDYIEITDSNVFPEGYELNMDSSVCVNKAGQTVEGVLSLNNDNLTVTSNQTVFCSLYFDPNSEIEIAVNTNGISGSVPSSLGYIKSISCDNGTASWNYKYNRLEMNTLASCDVSYTAKTSKPTLISKINDVKAASDINSGFCTDSSYTTQSTCTDAGFSWWAVAETTASTNYSHASKIAENDYLSSTMFTSSSYSATSGTSSTNAYKFDPTTNTWNNNPSVKTSNTSTYYHLQFNVKDDGKYKLCYEMSAGNTSNRMYLYLNGERQNIGTSNYLSAASGSVTSDCKTLSTLSAGDTIKIANRVVSTISTLNISLQKVHVDYRYTGKSPDNYVWFNNELWRIIGSVATSTSSGRATSENLVKIIRNEALGGFTYDKDSSSSSTTKTWGNNSLYTLLNSYYYGSKDGANYCYGYGNGGTAVGNCDYSYIGINPNSEYGKMVKNVYWNTGANSIDNPNNSVYNSEIATQTVPGYVGIMNVSDYGYAVLSGTVDSGTDISSFDTYKQCQNNWLFYGGNVWTLAPPDSSEYSYHNIVVNIRGAASQSPSEYGYLVRPVVYLDASVYVLEGDGSITNPYILAMD